MTKDYRSSKKVTPASKIAAPPIQDILDDLANSIKRATIESCARVAEIHVSDEAPIGWNAACKAIAAKIREL